MATLRQGTPIWCLKCSEEGKRHPIKPSVVFFNESLPQEFREMATVEALSKVDLLLIVGTTLKVGPFNSIPLKVKPTVPQVLINNQVE